MAGSTCSTENGFLSLPELKAVAQQAKKEALELLNERFDIDERFIVKIKPTKSMRGGDDRKSWMGCYRSHTIVTGHGIPIFWIAEDIESKMQEYGIEVENLKDVIKETLLHEYGHAIEDLARLRAPELHTFIVEGQHAFLATNEDFAEEFMRYCTGKTLQVFAEKFFVQLIDLYKRLCFGAK